MRRTVPTLVLLFLALVCTNAFAAAASTPRVHLLRLSATINPVTADFVAAGLTAANDQGAAAFLLEIDTPGGLDTSMREIVQAILASQVPVIVYVAPAGARAASAGAIIVLAADLAAMAPGTNLGAAHPVSVGLGGALKGEDATMAAKITNDAAAYARSLAEQRGRNGDWAEKIVRESLSTAASEAQRLNVVEILADDRQQLLTLADGRSYLRNGNRLQLQLAGAEVVETRMDLRRQILNAISHPNVAYLLLMLGILGIFFEISQPGVVLPGAIGAIALLLAFLAFQTLPVNYVGVLLIVLAAILFLLEIKIVSYGMLSVAGIAALLFGSLILFPAIDPLLRLSWTLVLATVAVVTAVCLFAVQAVVRTQRRPVLGGVEGMVGERGEALCDLEPAGQVFVHGETWDAEAQQRVAKGATVTVVAVLPGLRLQVRGEGVEEAQPGNETIR